MDARLRFVSRVDTTPLHVVKQSCTAILEDGHLALPTTRFEGWNKQRNITTIYHHFIPYMQHMGTENPVINKLMKEIGSLYFRNEHTFCSGQHHRSTPVAIDSHGILEEQRLATWESHAKHS